MKPGFLSVVTYGNPPTEIPRPDGRTSGRRLALAEWIGSPQNPLTARVIVNRALAEPLRPRHRRDARELRQDGRAADASGAARLAGGRVHEPRLEHQADQQADDDVRGLPDGLGLRARAATRRAIRRTATCGASARSGSTPRSCATACWPSAATSIWRSAASRSSRSSPKDILDRAVPRQVGEHARRARRPGGAASTSIAGGRCRIPMFDTFDHPDMNVTAGARNVSTVPTQALTLLNNPFVLAQAELLAERVSSEAERSGDAGRSRPIGSRWRGRRPKPSVDVALELVKAQSLGRFHPRAAEPRRVHLHEVSHVASMQPALLGSPRVPVPVGRRHQRPGAGVSARSRRPAGGAPAGPTRCAAQAARA